MIITASTVDQKADGLQPMPREDAVSTTVCSETTSSSRSTWQHRPTELAAHNAQLRAGSTPVPHRVAPVSSDCLAQNENAGLGLADLRLVIGLTALSDPATVLNRIPGQTVVPAIQATSICVPTLSAQVRLPVTPPATGGGVVVGYGDP